MAFTTPGDFKRYPYIIANVDIEDEDGDLTAVIDEQEKERLEKLLGSSLYKSFIDGLGELPDDWDADITYTVGQQVAYGVDLWDSIANGNTGNIPSEGANWTLAGANNVWLLLKNGDEYTYMGKHYKWIGMNKMLKPYIWFMWESFIAKRSTSTGRKEAKAENSTVVSASPAMCGAFNMFAAYAGARREKRNSLYGYLISKSESGVFDGSFDDTFNSLATYLNFVFQDPGYTNPYNL